MRKIFIFQTLLFLFLCSFARIGFTWDRSIDFGYGFSHDPNNIKYNNSGFFLSGDFWPIWRNNLSFWSLNGALGQWYTTAPNNKNLTTAAVALALRFYPMTSDSTYPIYLLGSAGPAWLSTKQYGTNQQGANWAFQTFVGFGFEHDHFDANLRFVHFSNAGLANPNQGYNILYVLSLGYLFG